MRTASAKKLSKNSMKLKIFSVQLLALAVCAAGIFTFTSSADAAQVRSRQEQYRPQIHFTPKKFWMNDPNGMVWDNGEYHLFYQHNPNDSHWGPMHWGHAVSPDLIHWYDRPIALYPDSLGTIFSGSAVIDHKNTAGFGKDAMIAIFTQHGEKEVQSIAYSTDHGLTFTKYEGNPVIQNPGKPDFRDPKVSWHEKSGKWVLVLAAGDVIQFYNSPDLKTWELTSEFGKGIGSHTGVWECPDLFSLPLGKKEKWVLLVSNGGNPGMGCAVQYFVGDFDGKTFKADPAPYPMWIDYGRDVYAGVTWSNLPQEKRRLFLAWMCNPAYAGNVPTEVWRSADTLPRDLKLIPHKDGYAVLSSSPAKEFFKYAGREIGKFSGKITDTQKIALINQKYNLQSDPWMAELALKLPANGLCDLILSNAKGEQCVFTIDKAAGKIRMDRSKSGKIDMPGDYAKVNESPLYTEKDEILLSLWVDHSSVELFVENGIAPQTTVVFPENIFNTITIRTQNGPCQAKLKAKTLDSIWK